PSQLCAQIVARLQVRSEPEIAALLEDARRAEAAPLLNLRSPTVDSPGCMLVTPLVGHSHEALALAADRKFETLVSGGSDTTVRVLSPRDGQLLRIFDRHKLGVRALAVSADGSLALAGGADGFVYSWDLTRGERLGRLPRDIAGGIRGLALSADG